MQSSGQFIRGVKRRRDAKESEEDREAKLRRKLHHALRELRKVAKKVKTFEVQKTLKKLKDVRCKDAESDLTKDLEAQMEILKCLSCDQLARSALMTKLKKNKILSADPLIRTLSADLASNPVPPGTPGTPSAKVQSRILSSKVIASEVVLIVENLRTLLFPSSSAGLEKIEEAIHNSHSSPNTSKKMRTENGHKNGTSSSKENRKYEDASNDSDDAIAETDDDWESGTVGGSSESDDSPVNHRLSEANYVTESVDGYDDVTFDPSDLDDDTTGDLKKSGQPHDSKDQSEFLPSLSVGFTRGDSDSEFSDSEAKLVDGNKKNRRGQRARRAIWEKKFGKNANHIKKQQEPQAERARRRSIPLDRRSGKGSGRHAIPGRSTNGHQQVRRPSMPVSDERVNDLGGPRRSSDLDLRRKQDGPLHPSWEAKRKQTAASIVPSQGTKIVFSKS